MQLAGDPSTLVLLDKQRSTPALAPLGLEAVQHVVESMSQGGDDRTALDRNTCSGSQRVVLTHRLDEVIEWAERGSQKHEIECQQAQPGHEDEYFGIAAGGTETVSKDQAEECEHQDRRVRAEYSPEQRHRVQARTHRSSFHAHGGRREARHTRASSR